MPCLHRKVGKDRIMEYALMNRDFDGLRKNKYYPIVDTLIDDGSAVVDLNQGRGKEQLRCIPPEYFIPMSAEQIATLLKKDALRELK